MLVPRGLGTGRFGPVPSALILGGTGVIGRAAAARLAAAGWSVDVVGRNQTRMPSTLTGVSFRMGNRRSPESLADLVGSGFDLVVDCLAFTASDARMLLPFASQIGALVVLSSKAVYVDDQGRHVNSPDPPQFTEPISESQATMTPREDVPFDSPEGYGANKVAAERVLLESRIPTTVVRASKVHGVGNSRPREWVFVKRVLDQRPAVFFNQGGLGADHTTAAANTAALIETVALQPGDRIVNSGDPDPPSGPGIARAVASYFDLHWDEIVLAGPHELGDHPWNLVSPVRLDLSASEALGYRPVGTFAQTVGAEIEWLLSSRRNQPSDDDPYFGRYFPYEEEDRLWSSLEMSRH